MKRALVALILLVVLVVAAVVLLPSWASRSTPYVRDRIVQALNARFASQVDIDVLHVDVYPRPEISGERLRLRYNGRTDIPPLIAIATFDAGASLRGLWGKPLHLQNVTLNGLDIRIPLGGLNPDAAPDPPDTLDTKAPPRAVATTGVSESSSLIIDEIVSRQARLEIPTRKPGRLPRIFEIQDLVMSDFGRPEGARFHAGILNPVPKGRVETSGVFGPWNTEEPDKTPIRGEYAFTNANLDVIKGIGGILSSVGTYKGVFERIEVDGQTETPDFSIDIAGQPVPLTTKFKALVDATNGDTWLERVEATLAKSTTIIASGAVVRTKDVKGRRVQLDVHVDHARLEDLMRLAVKTTKPPIVGGVDIVTKFLLPAGPGSVIDRLQLDGRFTLAKAKFTNIDVQKKITLLSQRGRGDEGGDGDGESVVSNLRGRFTLRNARLSFADLAFSVPGATVELAGTYDLKAETIDFAGNLLTEASLADMTSGYKAVLARLAQPFFRRPGGGSKLPIRISGTRGKPTFKLDVKRVFSKG